MAVGAFLVNDATRRHGSTGVAARFDDSLELTILVCSNLFELGRLAHMKTGKITPEIFQGMTLTPQEQAKVDVLRANWARDGERAMDAFVAAEPSLVLRAVDRVFGSEPISDALFREMIDMGPTVADLARLLKRTPH